MDWRSSLTRARSCAALCRGWNYKCDLFALRRSGVPGAAAVVRKRRRDAEYEAHAALAMQQPDDPNLHDMFAAGAGAADQMAGAAGAEEPIYEFGWPTGEKVLC
jgi:hypothetical protein